MNAELLLQQFHRLAEAPGGIPRLRRFILDLAVRGKLTEQDPNDEPAAELLKKIEKEKAKLVKEGKIRKGKELPPISDAEIPFDLPDGWVAMPLISLGITQTGNTPSKNHPEYFGNYIPFIKPGDLTGPEIDYNGEGLSEEGVKYGRIIPKGSVMMVCIGSTIGKTSKTERTVCCNQQINTLTPFIPNCADFIIIAFKSEGFQQQVWRNAGIGTLPIINKGKWEKLPIPLPPLAEQERIVAKVDELMALCDQLQEAQREREAGRDALTAASFHLLNNSADANEFRANARFFFDNLPRLVARPDQIKKLRETILSLAVRGKLTEQDPNDEPAAELLKKIEKEKARLVKEGKIKKGKELPPISDAEIPFEVPDGWVMTQLRSLGITQTGNTPSKNYPEYFGTYIPFIKPADLTGPEINYNGEGLSEEGAKYGRIVPKGSVMMVCIGSTIGKTNKAERDVSCNQQINTLTPYILDCADFIVIALKSQAFQQKVWQNAGTGTLPIINKGKWEKLRIPLPPIAEQERIVAKVDELMALCDRLEESIEASRKERAALLEGVLHGVFAEAALQD